MKKRISSAGSFTKNGLKACLIELSRSNPIRISIPKDMTTKGTRSKSVIPKNFIFDQLRLSGTFFGACLPFFSILKKGNDQEKQWNDHLKWQMDVIWYGIQPFMDMFRIAA